MILRLYNCEFAQIDLSQYAAIIEAEPQKIFLSMLEDLAISPETPKELSLYEGEKRVKQSDIFLVSDVWNFDICSKALLTKIYKHLEAAVFRQYRLRYRGGGGRKRCVFHVKSAASFFCGNDG